MNSEQNKNIIVPHSFIRNNTAFVTFNIPNYSTIMKGIVIGEYLSSIKPFDLNFADFPSKWKLIFYPKGQYDYGKSSNNCRLYMKMLSCNKSDRMLKISISVKSTTKEFVLDFNNNHKNWVGPFQTKILNVVCDALTIQCTFEIIRAENEKNYTMKRVLSSDNNNILMEPPSTKHRPKDFIFAPSVRANIREGIYEKNEHKTDYKKGEKN